jgi:hypothetical protein
MSNFIKGSINISIELYRDGDKFSAYLSDDIGGSGIEASGATPEEAANNLAPYIADYFYESETEEDDDED